MRIAAFLLFASAALAQDQQRVLDGPITPEQLRDVGKLVTVSATDWQQLLKDIQQFKDKTKGLSEADQAAAARELVKEVVPKLSDDAKDMLKDRLHEQVPEITPAKLREIVQQPPVNPFNPGPSRTPSSMRDSPAFRNLVKFWEKNVGPIDNTPQLKKAIQDLLARGAGNTPASSDPFAGMIDTESPWGREVGDWLEQLSENGGWPSLGLGSISLPELGSSGGGMGFSTSTSDGPSATVLLGIAAVGIIVVLVLRTPWKAAKQATILTPLLDPATVTDRAGVIAAFEQYAVRALGEPARTWNHRTIERAWATRVESGLATVAAQCYEHARYAPDEFTSEELTTARGSLQRLREALA